MKTIFITALMLVAYTGPGELFAQTYTPVTVTGFNNDVVAETGANAAAVTSTTLDLSFYVLYSAAFAAANGLAGGLVNSGTIVNGMRTYQLAPYNGPNGLFLSLNGGVPNSAAAGTLTLAAPASFSKISLLLFSTEGASTISATLNFTDGTTATGGAMTVQDWFGGGNAVASGYGRIARNTAPPYLVDGLTSNDPRFYRFDIPLACSNQVKQLQSVSINFLGGGTTFPSRAVIMALSGIAATPLSITPTVTPATCGAANGGISLAVTGGAPPLTYSWNTVPVQTQPVITNQPGGVYTCTIADANGCTTLFEDSIPQRPAAAISIAASATAVCEGSAVTLTAIANGAVSNYNWQPGNAAGAGITVTPAATTRYVVTAQDAFGCRLSDAVVVAVIPMPVAAFSADVTIGCPDLPVTFTNQSQNADSWLWRFGDTVLSSARSPVHNYTAAGSYTVTLVAGTQGRCFDTLVKTALINVQPLPVARFTTLPGLNAPLELSEALFSFTNQSVNGAVYAWDFGDGTVSTAAAPSHRYALPGSYRVTLVVTNGIGCTDSTSQAWLKVVPDAVLRIPNAFSPNGDGVNDRWEIPGLAATPGCQVQVFNRWGQSVFESIGYGQPWDGTWHGQLLPVGTYYYVIKAKQKDKPYAGWVALLR